MVRSTPGKCVRCNSPAGSNPVFSSILKVFDGINDNQYGNQKGAYSFKAPLSIYLMFLFFLFY